MINVAVIEDEKESVEGAFDYANLVLFNKALKISYFPTSQKFFVNNDASNYDYIFVDIDLKNTSLLNGVEVIERLRLLSPELLKKIIVLTADQKVKERLDFKGMTEIPILYKPIHYRELDLFVKA
ncbi:MAG: response regulator [Imperialibacter sp.]|uniref:response regulator n=1 Tax=Imperialibacter sp. TaxID=2038411 RepID=UPI0032EE2FDB